MILQNMLICYLLINYYWYSIINNGSYYYQCCLINITDFFQDYFTVSTENIKQQNLFSALIIIKKCFLINILE